MAMASMCRVRSSVGQQTLQMICLAPAPKRRSGLMFNRPGVTKDCPPGLLVMSSGPTARHIRAALVYLTPGDGPEKVDSPRAIAS